MAGILPRYTSPADADRLRHYHSECAVGLMVFDYIKATTDGGPGFATMSIAMEIYKHAFTDMKFAYSSAESTVTFLLITVIAIIQLWCSRVKE